MRCGSVSVGKLLGHVTEFAGHHGPTVLRQPLRGRMHRCPVEDEARAGRAVRNVVVLLVSQRFDFIRAGFNGRGLDVRAGVGMMRLDEADVIEKKLVAAGVAELALLEQHADFRRGAVHVVRIALR